MPWIKRNIYPILLTLLCLVICYLNYKPNTFLTGWDTLHPELNFPLNFSRLINGVWRYEQGLGAIAGHSHMADLPRVFLLWLFHFIFPINFLRYAYIFLCFILGPLGIYYLIRYLFKKDSIAFVIAIFYIFNLSTVQQFYVPFEMFPTQWAFLPFIILYSLKYLQTNHKKYLLLYSLFTLFAAPQAYAAHLWYAFFAVYLVFLFLHFLLKRNKRIFNLILFTLALNAFWLLPNIYYIFSSSSIPKNTKVNRLYSQEYLLQNRATGYLRDVALVKGFYFNWQIYNPQTSKFENLLPSWEKHLSNPLISLIGYLTFFLSFSGFILSFVKKNKTLIYLSPFFVIPLILLLNHTPPFSYLFDFLLRFSIFEESFRFIFTKISILFTFGIAIYLAFFLSVFKLKILNLIIILALLIYGLPMFTGQLISPKMKVAFPHQYTKFWNYMNQLPQGTILPLPLHNFTGWQYYNWGYQGAGFIWFNLKQPILDRDFDRWAPQNEQAYREFFYSLYSKNPKLFISTLQKYNMKYIFWDQSVITPYVKNRNQILFENEIQTMLNYLEKEKIIQKTINFDFLHIYTINNDSSKNISKEINNYIKTPYLWHYWDPNPLPYYSPKPSIGLLGKSEKIDIDQIEALLDRNKINILLDQPKVYKSLNRIVGGFYNLLDLKHDEAYIIGFHSRHQKGLPFRICIKNIYNNICTIYEQLSDNQQFTWDYYLIPPQDEFIGYSISVDSISLGDYETSNELAQIVVIPVDYNKITAVSPENKPQNIQTNGQSYHQGWISIPSRPHVLVNNWQNGWLLPSSYNLQSKIYYLFWPQLLEYLGFILTFGALYLSFRRFR